MSEQWLLLLGLGALFVFVLFWALSIGIVLFDVYRRGIPGPEQVAWVALATLLPLLGFLAYLFLRVIDLYLTPREAGQSWLRRRSTMPMRVSEPEKRLPTLPMADLARQTVAGPDLPLPQASAARPPAYAAARSVARPAYRLFVVEGPYAGMELPLDALPLRIGRGPEAGLRLDEDKGVSRQHAEIYEQAGVLRIRDLHSTHGTRVNSYSVSDKSLDPGDRIQVGNTVLAVNLERGQ
jgi:hypothetical protein